MGFGVPSHVEQQWRAGSLLVTHLVDAQQFDKNDEDAHPEINTMSSFRGQGRGQRHATLAKGNNQRALALEDKIGNRLMKSGQ